ncbi:15501_t:CDS:2, partial [Racocetra persica]
TNYKRIFCKDRIDAFDTFLEFSSSSSKPITIKDPMNAEEYVNSNNNLITTEVLNDDKIIEAVKNHECIEPENEISNKPISFAQALEFIDKILLFFEQQPDSTFKIDNALIQNLGKLKKELRLKILLHNDKLP